MATSDEIVEATVRALREHGYADLTMAAIGKEFSKSTSLIHYHFDSKEDLLAACLETKLEEFLAGLRSDADAAPTDQLLRLAEYVARGTGEDGVDEFHSALLELRAQAPYSEALREQFVRNDREVRAHVERIVREGIERGEFRAVDPERYAALFRSAIEGAQSHNVILGEEAPSEAALAGVHEYLIRDLLVESDGTDAEGSGA
jgi:AcrR family transcriptional regulator